jgi:hypothetical protein
MAIDLPNNAPRFIQSFNFWLETNTQAFESPISRSIQTIELSGARWRASYTLRPMIKSDASIWKVFLLKLKGRAEFFNAYDPDYTRQGVGGGSPVVLGSGQTGNTLLIDGVTPLVSGWLKAGDYFSVNGELKQVTQDINTDVYSQATLVFEPRLRNSPGDNAVINITNPTCRMKLIDDSQQSWELDYNKIYPAKTFSGVETFT